MSDSSDDHNLEKGGTDVRHEDMLKRVRTAGSVTISPEIFESMFLAPKTQVAGSLRVTFGNPTGIGMSPKARVWDSSLITSSHRWFSPLHDSSFDGTSRLARCRWSWCSNSVSGETGLLDSTDIVQRCILLPRWPDAYSWWYR